MPAPEAEITVSSIESPRGRSIYDARHLARNAANFAALSPVGFLQRSAKVYPDKLAIVHGAARVTYGRFHERCRQFADALHRRGVRRGETGAVLPPNVPALLEAHYRVPMAGAVLHALNYRLDAPAVPLLPSPRPAKLVVARPAVSPTLQ